MVEIAFSRYSVGIVYNDIQEVCGTSRLVTALVLTVRWGSIALLTSFLMLNI